MRLIAYCFAAVLLMASLGLPAPADSVVNPVACPAHLKADHCLYVSVPENRQRSGRTIRLFTAIFRSQALEKAAEPVIFLSGGPGEVASNLSGLSRLFPRHDFILFDQRGVGLSQPELQCGEYLNTASGLGLEMNQTLAERQTEALIACGQRLRQSGVDLEAYTASESAADVEAIRQALGYARVNLLAVSYGTRVAQEVLRRYPGSLRAVILDSVVPAQIDRMIEMPRSIEEALQSVFAACAADADCNAAYPNLAAVYRQLLARLEREPAAVTVAGEPARLESRHVRKLVHVMLYAAGTIAELPGLIYQLHRGQYQVIEQVMAPRDDRQALASLNFGAFYASECPGEIAHSSLQALERSYRDYPQWRDSVGLGPGIASPRAHEICHAWKLEQAARDENQPVRSKVPALLLTGAFDPVTPPRFQSLLAQGLSKAHSFVFPGQSHGVTLSTPCGISMMWDFLESPAQKPDTSCLEDLKPRFRQW